MYIEDQIATPKLELLDEIQRIKDERNAIILAHYYQDPDIQDIADHVGDSLMLSQIAAETDADIIVFCGVHFMAETAKILNPEKTVLLPDLEAGCSLADSCPAELFQLFRERHPDHMVVSYINTTAAVKALSDIICTSSNAERIIASIPENQPIIFAPDRHMGRWLMKITGRKMKIWDGVCEVHDIFSEEEILRLKAENPDAMILAHPECDETILRHADLIGSTSSIINEAINGDHHTYIVATEEGVVHQMNKQAPHKTFIPAPTTTGCACNQCPYMRKNTIEKVYSALNDLHPEIVLDETLRLQAKDPLDRMLALS